MNKEDAVSERDEAMNDEEGLDMGTVVNSDGRPTILTFGKAIPLGVVDPFSNVEWMFDDKEGGAQGE